MIRNFITNSEGASQVRKPTDVTEPPVYSALIGRSCPRGLPIASPWGFRPEVALRPRLARCRSHRRRLVGSRTACAIPARRFAGVRDFPPGRRFSGSLTPFSVKTNSKRRRESSGVPATPVSTTLCRPGNWTSFRINEPALCTRDELVSETESSSRGIRARPERDRIHGVGAVTTVYGGETPHEGQLAIATCERPSRRVHGRWLPSAAARARPDRGPND